MDPRTQTKLRDRRELDKYCVSHAGGKLEFGVNDCHTFTMGWYQACGYPYKTPYYDFKWIKKQLRDNTLLDIYKVGLEYNEFQYILDYNDDRQANLKTGDIVLLPTGKKRLNAVMGLVVVNETNQRWYTVFLGKTGIAVLTKKEEMEFYRCLV